MGAALATVRAMDAESNAYLAARDTAAQAVVQKRLELAITSHPVISRMQRLTDEAKKETFEQIASHKGHQGRGQEGLFSQPHRDAIELACQQLAIHLLKPSTEALAAWGAVLGSRLAPRVRWVDRPVLDLPAGTGKTESAKAVIHQSIRMWKAGQLGDGPFPGVMFVTDSIDQLEDVYSCLVGRGLDPASEIGLFHTKRDRRQHPVIEMEQCKDYPVLLMCTQQIHSRAKDLRRGKGPGLDPFVVLADGGRRQLICKDETLMTTAAHQFAPGDLEHLLSSLQHDQALNAEPTRFQGVRDFVEQTVDQVNQAQQALLATDGNHVETIELPPMDEALAGDAETAAGLLVDGNANSASTLRSLAEVGSTTDLQAALHRKSTGAAVMCKSVPTWPAELNQVCVLDANWSADLLSQSSSVFERASILELAQTTSAQLKGMQQLRIHIAEGPSGRGAMQQPKARNQLIRNICKEVKRIESETPDQILIFVFKPDKYCDYTEVIRRKLVQSTGLKDGQICIWEEGFNATHRVAIQTWGLHKATNAFATCRHIFFLGVLQQEGFKLQVGSWAEQQKHDQPLCDLPWDVNELRRSQICCDVNQALMRGTARNTIDGKADRCDVYLQLEDPARDPKALVDVLRKLLGNFSLKEWRIAGADRPRLASVLPDLIRDVVIEKLDDARACGKPEKVSFSVIKNEVLARQPRKTLADDTWRKYRAEASVALQSAGVLEVGRSWARNVF